MQTTTTGTTTGARIPIGVRPRGMTQRSEERPRPARWLPPAKPRRAFDLDDVLAATLLALLAAGYLTAFMPLLIGMSPAGGWPLA